jgi:membrane protein
MTVPEAEGLRLLMEVSKRSITKFLRHYMSSWAAALAYHALFAIVPFLALLVVLLWLLGIGNFFIEGLTDQTSSAALQGPTAEAVEQWIGIEQSEYQTLGGWISFAIISISIAVWSVSDGIRTLTRALNTAYEVEETRPSWKRYGVSFFYALGLAVMVILGSALLLIGPELVGRVVGLVGLDEMFISLWTWLRLPVALVLLMLAVSIVYWAVPNVNYPYRLITPGAALAVIVWILASLGFSFYLANFANYSAVYGSLGLAFVLLLYFYTSASVLLLGAEVNAAVHYYSSYRHTQVEEHKTDREERNADERSRKDN